MGNKNHLTLLGLIARAAIVSVFTSLPAGAALIVHRYDFENENGNDSVGTVDGAVNGDPVFTADAVSGDRSITLDGDGDYVLFSEPMDFGNQFSIALWVKPDPAALGIQNLLGNAPGGWGTDGFKLFYNTWSEPATADGALHLETGDGPGGSAGDGVRSEEGIIAEAAWKHVVATVDTDTGMVAMYVDGAALPTTGGLNLGMKTDSPWELGRMMGSWDLTGSVDDVQVYLGVLSADAANWLYSNPGAVIPEPAGAVTWMALLAIVGTVSLCRRIRRGLAR
jgi:hypothetical protein